jgi:hypothetical protein
MYNLRKFPKLEEPEEISSGSEDEKAESSSSDDEDEMTDLEEKITNSRDFHRLDMNLQLLATLFKSLKKRMGAIWAVRSTMLESFGVDDDDEPMDGVEEAAEEGAEEALETWGDETEDGQLDDDGDKNPVQEGGNRADAVYWAGEMKLNLELLDTIRDKFNDTFDDTRESAGDLVESITPVEEDEDDN